jgi:hypothetical protein
MSRLDIVVGPDIDHQSGAVRQTGEEARLHQMH